MAKGDKFYFENFNDVSSLSKKASEYLVECLQNYNLEKAEEMLSKMHEFEHSADLKKHEMMAALAKAFVTPIEREDLNLISHKLDDILDSLEEILQKFYIYNIKKVPASAVEFAEKLVYSCDLLGKIMKEFENFKRSKQILPLIIELNDVEEECDKIYLKSINELTKNPEDLLETISLCKIFDCFEVCADATEHVGDCIETVIMKNT